MGVIDTIYDSNIAFVNNKNFSGVKKIIVDNYSDEAHFVYELLQNADDAKATEITFDLKEDMLVITHNGIPFTENDLNGICSISMGTKSDDYTKIGKFGIGFKSVFVYTDTPQIFSGNYQFEIKDLVLPREIKCNLKIKKEDTVFILPFNAKKTRDIAYERIEDKLYYLHEEAIMFLKNIRKINVEISDTSIQIEKEVLDKYEFNTNEEYEHIRISRLNSEFDDDEYEPLHYCMIRKNGISLSDTDEEGKPVKVENQSVMLAYLEYDNEICALSDDEYYEHEDCYFVFFPTRIQSNCEFFVHAPFVTKSSRDTIALNNVANDELMTNIGQLIADSMIVLAKEKKLTVELLERLYFDDGDDAFGNKRIRESFNAEYKKLLNGHRALIPCEEDSYRTLKGVLFSSETEHTTKLLKELFDAKWLGELYGCSNVPALCQVDRRSEFYQYMKKNFNSRKLDISEIIQNLDKKFYEEKTSEWFKKYCKLIISDDYYGYSAKYKNLDSLPLIRTIDKKHLYIKEAAKIYLNNGTLDESLLDSDEVNYLYKEIFKLKDYSTELSEAKEAIKTIKADRTHDFDNHIVQIRKLLIALDNKKISVKDLENQPIIRVANQKDGTYKYVAPSISRVGRWERTNGAFDLYTLCAGVNIDLTDPRYLDSLSTQELKKLGCKADGLGFSEGSRLKFFSNNPECKNYYDATHLRPLQGRANNRLFRPLYQMEYFEEILDAPMSIEKSVIILRLAKEFDTQIKDWVEWSSRQDFGQYAAYKGYAECYSLFGISLINHKWMIDKNGNQVSPAEVTSDELAQEYRKIMTADIADILGMKKSSSERLDSVNQKLKSDGFFAIPLSEKEAYEEFRRQQATRKAEMESWNQSDRSDEGEERNHSSDRENTVDESDEMPASPASKVMRDITKKIKEKKPQQEKRIETPEYEDVDQDEYTPAVVDYSKRIELAKKKSAAEIEKIAHFEEIQNKAVSAEKYTYKWFNALLEMESINSGEANANSREVSISFSKIDREPGKLRTYILKHPDRYIPQFMEDLADIPMVIHMGDRKKTVAIEVASIKSYTLRVKLKNAADMEDVDLGSVNSITIDAKSPVFLIEELRKQFGELNLEDGFNMQENLCENIEFIFGPPGTGKTTYLAKDILLPLMKDNSDCKVLVLTPTNKSADVLTKRIMEVSDDDTYKKWLIRFGATGDEQIEQSPVFKEKTFDIRALKKNVTVTTIARFPYDYFMPQGARLFLNGLNWDYIVVDEASMIPLANIIYPLYKKEPKKFIIAGDPFQIEPITSVDLWKDENIYKMVKLDSFTDPTTIPYKYKVTLLTTQYRSIPAIGGIFSNFAYGGILNHYRSADSQRPLNTGNDLGIETLNIIKFPVSKYESIYRCKRLQHSSSYQVYSALFTFEYISYLSKAIAENNKGGLFKIGVIAPYRAQADMIDKLLASEKLPPEVDVQVGTIHGFQGDECDIIFAVFNTPPSISSSKEMFLNKRNIINVSISRARDYLFVVMPDDDTENVANLKLVKRVEKLITETDEWNEFQTHDLEDIMFDDSNYLEKNAFSTSHQSVNVYGLPENCYEVRTEENAVDVQIHRARQTGQDENLNEKTTANEVVDSYDLDENRIPEELRKTAEEVPVKGALKGWCFVVPYDGKLKTHTAEITQAMFIPLMRNGQEKLVSVSVAVKDRIVYIPENMFKIYEHVICDVDGIELRQ